MSEIVQFSKDPAEDFQSEAVDELQLYYEERRGRYWHQDSTGRWIDKSEPQIKRLMRQLGMRSKADFQNGELVSAIEARLIEVETEQRVFYAGPLAGYKAGLHEMGQERILVTRSPQLVPPEKGDFDLLFELFTQMLADEAEQIDQRVYFFGWLQHALKCLYNGWWSGGLCLVLAGEPKCGKTLLTGLLKVMLGGSGISPYRYMTQQDNFNEELYEHVLQLIDDEAANTAKAARQEFKGAIKQVVATEGGRMRGMHAKGMALRPLWRLVICTNLEPDNLMVLPPVDDDIADKLLLLKAYKREKMPMPSDTIEDRRAFWSALMAQLPAFVHWLLHEFELPERLRDRFGVRHYHHPEILEALQELSPEMWLHDLVQRVLFSGARTEWEGSASDLEAAMKHADSPLLRSEKDRLPAVAWIGRKLGKLSAQFGEACYKQERGSGRNRDRRWIIKPPLKEVLS